MKDSHGVAEVKIQTVDCLLCYVFQSRFFVHAPFFAKQFTDYFFDTILSQVIKLENVFWSVWFSFNHHTHSKVIITLPDIYPVRKLFCNLEQFIAPNKIDTIIFVINVFIPWLFDTNVLAPLVPSPTTVFRLQFLCDRS